MATKMMFVCGCGALFDIGDSTDMEAHIDIHTSHAVAESVVHESTTPSTLTAIQDSLVVQIRTKRDNDRLERVVLAEYPAASGKWWRCGRQSQSDWSSLVSLDSMGAVVYPFRAFTFDERDHYDVVDSADLAAAVTAVSTAVLVERWSAQGYMDAVLAAVDEASARAAAAPYLEA